MSDTNETTETIATPAVETPATAAAPAAKPESEPSYIRDRIDRAQKTILKEMGLKVGRGEDPQSVIDEFKSEREAKKAERRELREKVVAHEATIQRLSASEAAVKIFAEMEFAALTEAQQAIVKTAAGDDPNERLKTIAMMKALKPEAPVAAAAPLPIPAPAQTAPAAAAPAPSTSQAVDVRAEHERLKSVSPLAAAAFLLQNRNAYYQQK